MHAGKLDGTGMKISVKVNIYMDMNNMIKDSSHGEYTRTQSKIIHTLCCRAQRNKCNTSMIPASIVHVCLKCMQVIISFLHCTISFAVSHSTQRKT